VIDIEENQLIEIGVANINQFRPIQPNPWRPFDEQAGEIPTIYYFNQFS